MSLSYTLRLLCVLVVVAGLIQIAAQFILAPGVRLILQRLESAPARRRERILFLLQIGPALVATFIAFAVCLPAYIRFESNRDVESVSLVCLLMAAGIGLWFAFAVLKGLRVTLRTLRFTRACRLHEQPLGRVGSIPMLRAPNVGLPVGLVGLLRPVIIISAEFVDVANRLDPDALALALAHEHAHATHHDNWKLLTLALLPRLDRFLPGGDRLFDLWKTAADWAADDDAVQGDPARALLLAETLVWAARCAHSSRPSVLCTPLTSAEAAIAARIERLTRLQCDFRSDSFPIPPCLAALAVLAGGVFAFSPWIYAVSEWLLHLGAA
jgi:hypothetical protein